MRKKLMIFQTILLMLALVSGCSQSAADDGGRNDGPSTGAERIVWTPQAPLRGQIVTFTVDPAADDVRSVLWTFGDGATSGDRQAQHSYQTVGDFAVKAYLTRTSGAMDELSATVRVSDSEASIQISNDFPARMERLFVSLNRIQQVAHVTWNFGDGSAAAKVTDPTERLEHRYEKTGSYTIAAKVVYTDGGEMELTQQVTVAGESLTHLSAQLKETRDKIWIVAHRGNTDGGYSYAPNSLTGFRKCVEAGCVDMIETDAQITKDGVVICLHDNYLKRFTDYGLSHNDEGYVQNFTYDEIKKYHLVTTDGKTTSEVVPTLEEVLMEFRGKMFFNIDKCSDDDKSTDAIARVYEVVARCGCLDRVVFYVGNKGTRNAEWLTSRELPATLMPHANSQSQMNTMTACQPYYIVQASTATLESNLSWLSTVNAYGLSMSNCLDNYQSDFRGGNTALMDRFVAAGLNIIQCDYPAEMHQYLKSKGKR